MKAFTLALAAALAALPGSLMAQQPPPPPFGPPPPPPPATITVSGRGEAAGIPDLATLTLAVVSQAKTAADAAQATAKSATAVVDGLKGLGVAARDIATTSLDLSPVYGREAEAPKVVGYRAANRITLRLRDMAQVGAVLDKAVALGVNEIQGPTFSFDDPTRLRDEARRKAAADAQRVAKLYAEAMGVTLGPLRALSEDTAFPMPRPIPMMAKGLAAGAPPTPVEAGEMDVSATVTATFDVERPR
jgi:uncharacterized protein YggE